jgi:hypothetical protein
MTPNQFRKAALAFAEATESSHHGHPDFRVGGKIFATLGYPDDKSGVVMLGPEDQKFFVKQFGEMFTPVAGAWGKNGSTQINLPTARMSQVRAALEIAWARRAPKRLLPRKAD